MAHVLIKQIWIFIFILLFISVKPYASDWSTTEVHYQHGKLDTPAFAGGGKNSTQIFTFQHASGWKYGDNFFFVDHINDANSDNFNDNDFYGEVYFNFSLSKISSSNVSIGPIKDIGLLLGVNAAADPNVIKYLPGIRLSWDIPGFAFLNSDITAYIDNSDGVKAGTNNAPAEEDSYMVDINWAYPFSIGDYSFSLEGHMEFISSRQNEFGDEIASWFLAQPQLRFDLGKAISDKPDKIFIGLEWQYWQNKLGDKQTDENAVQALVVWRF